MKIAVLGSGVALGLALPVIALAAPTIPSTPDLGKAEGRCRTGESGPALLVNVGGLKDRKGTLKLEVYPSNDTDFLADDNILVSAGKTFRRVEQPVNASGNVQLCVRIPGPGSYSVSVLHDRDANRKFGLSVDGIGFTGNPKLGMRKPKAAATRVVVNGNGVSQTSVVMNYRKGLMSFGPLNN
ncbi:DUF2141 domain-containing protein [Novosphingobium sp.]|uniref:DUF2141 domain-containing protein n=1 Tax=Novosphingobium sp. TaxID=1874826 RepID=UPI0025E740C7|nr:DUF2141 domain-containing protein [Novosphingobium sp.]